MTSEVYNNFSALSKRLSAVERQLSNFTEMLNERQQGDIDYLAMELDVELEQPEEPEDFEEVE